MQALGSSTVHLQYLWQALDAFRLLPFLPHVCSIEMERHTLLVIDGLQALRRALSEQCGASTAVSLRALTLKDCSPLDRVDGWKVLADIIAGERTRLYSVAVSCRRQEPMAEENWVTLMHGVQRLVQRVRAQALQAAEQSSARFAMHDEDEQEADSAVAVVREPEPMVELRFSRMPLYPSALTVLFEALAGRLPPEAKQPPLSKSDSDSASDPAPSTLSASTAVPHAATTAAAAAAASTSSSAAVPPAYTFPLMSLDVSHVYANSSEEHHRRAARDATAAWAQRLHSAAAKRAAAAQGEADADGEEYGGEPSDPAQGFNAAEAQALVNTGLLSSALSGHNSSCLLRLVLTGNPMTLPAATVLSAALKACRSLQVLDVSECKLSGQASHALLQGVVHNPHSALEELRLDFNGLSDASARMLFEWLANTQTASAAASTAVAAAAKAGSSSGSGGGGSGAAAYGLCRLKALHARGCRLTARSTRALTTALQSPASNADPSLAPYSLTALDVSENLLMLSAAPSVLRAYVKAVAALPALSTLALDAPPNTTPFSIFASAVASPPPASRLPSLAEWCTALGHSRSLHELVLDVACRLASPALLKHIIINVQNSPSSDCLCFAQTVGPWLASAAAPRHLHTLCLCSCDRHTPASFEAGLKRLVEAEKKQAKAKAAPNVAASSSAAAIAAGGGSSTASASAPATTLTSTAKSTAKSTTDSKADASKPAPSGPARTGSSKAPAARITGTSPWHHLPKRLVSGNHTLCAVSAGHRLAAPMEGCKAWLERNQVTNRFSVVCVVLRISSLCVLRVCTFQRIRARVQHNWQRLSIVLAFMRANHTSVLRHSVLPLVPMIVALLPDPRLGSAAAAPIDVAAADSDEDVEEEEEEEDEEFEEDDEDRLQNGDEFENFGSDAD